MREHEQDEHGRYSVAKETKQQGTAVEKSETSTVPMKSGNSPHEDPAEGEDVQNEGTERGNDDGDSEL